MGAPYIYNIYIYIWH